MANPYQRQAAHLASLTSSPSLHTRSSGTHRWQVWRNSHCGTRKPNNAWGYSQRDCLQESPCCPALPMQAATAGHLPHPWPWSAASPPWRRPAAHLRWTITKLHDGSVMAAPWCSWLLELCSLKSYLVLDGNHVDHNMLLLFYTPEFTGLHPNQTSAPVSSISGPCLKPPSQPGLNLKSLYPHGTQLCF